MDTTRQRSVAVTLHKSIYEFRAFISDITVI
jgi:hypothetical protein